MGVIPVLHSDGPEGSNRCPPPKIESSPLRTRSDSSSPKSGPTVNGIVFQVDTSPWGAGTVLRRDLVIEQYWSCTLYETYVAHLGVKTGYPICQSFLEFLTILLCLVVWGCSDF